MELEKTASLSFWKRILLFVHFGLWDSEFFKRSPVSITALLQKHFYERRLAEMKARIDALEASSGYTVHTYPRKEAEQA